MHYNNFDYLSSQIIKLKKKSVGAHLDFRCFLLVLAVGCFLCMNQIKMILSIFSIRFYSFLFLYLFYVSFLYEGHYIYIKSLRVQSAQNAFICSVIRKKDMYKRETKEIVRWAEMSFTPKSLLVTKKKENNVHPILRGI